MTRRMLYLCAPLLTGLPAVAAAATAFTGATILPISDEPIENGVLVIEGQRIVAVGPADAVDIPSDADRVELDGGVIMPGLVDTHSHIGGVAGGDSSDPIQPAARVLDSIDVRDSGLDRARRGHHDRQSHARLRIAHERANAVREAARGQHDRGARL